MPADINSLQLSSPFTLPNGLVFPNRLIKAAMAEHMAGNDYLPDSKFDQVYSQWGSGGWGALLTGNVQVDPTWLGSASDVAPDLSQLSAVKKTWASWATAMGSQGTPAIMQISHPGRQSGLGAGKKGIWGKNIAPSAIPLDFGPGVVAKVASRTMFGTPKEMTVQQIETVVEQFARTAELAAEAGFAGVELHGAHGYLLDSFLSARSNLRTDAYGGTPAKRAKLVLDIIAEVRRRVPASFAVALKMNSVDHQRDSDMAACLEQVALVHAAKIDFLEISGGSYEDPTMQATVLPEKHVSASTTAREAFFLDFAKAIRQRHPDLVLMVTGGFRSRKGMEAALRGGGCDLVGIARPAAVRPQLPKEIILNRHVPDDEATIYVAKIEPSWLLKQIPVKSIGAGAQSAYFSRQIQRHGKGLPVETKHVVGSVPLATKA